MDKVGVVSAASIATFLEPRTSTSATTELARLLDAALGAYGFAHPERFCGHAGVN